MKILYVVFSLSLIVSCGSGGSDSSSSGSTFEPIDQRRIIFSGHSLTDAAVQTLRNIAMEEGDDLVDIYQSIPGSPIRIRTRGNYVDENSWFGYSEGFNPSLNLIDEILSPSQLNGDEVYDTLIITERHDLLGTIEFESTASLLRHFRDQLARGSSNSEVFFYQSWLGIKKDNPIPWVNYVKDMLVTWECISSKVNLTLEQDGQPQNVKTIAAGWAMAHLLEQAFLGNIPGITGTDEEITNLIFSDNVHPTELGEFFIGAFTYNNAFGKSAEGITIPASIDQNTGSALLALAWQLTLQYHQRADKGKHEMASCRAHIRDNICQPYHEYIFDEPVRVSDCQSFFGEEQSGNPFRWPDPNLVSWPDPL